MVFHYYIQQSDVKSHFTVLFAIGNIYNKNNVEYIVTDPAHPFLHPFILPSARLSIRQSVLLVTRIPHGHNDCICHVDHYEQLKLPK